MKKVLQHPHGRRAMSATAGAVVANFIVAVLVDQFGVPLHPNVVATGSVLLATIMNYLLAKFD